MNRTSRHWMATLLVSALALILTLLFSGGEGVRAMLQDSPVSTPTLPVPELPLPDLVDQPTIEPFPTLEPPTSVPLPPTLGPTPTAWGFLPAPTIVNPDEVRSLPLAQPRTPSADALARPTVPSPPAAARSSARAAITLLNYAWVVCGGVLLIGGVVAILLIWRRGQQP